jgi:hypothetical protein
MSITNPAVPIETPPTASAEAGEELSAIGAIHNATATCGNTARARKSINYKTLI